MFEGGWLATRSIHGFAKRQFEPVPDAAGARFTTPGRIKQYAHELAQCQLVRLLLGSPQAPAEVFLRSN
jgi:hypothetical protein